MAGVSQVERALEVARRKAADAGLAVEFVQQDMTAALEGPLQVGGGAGFYKRRALWGCWMVFCASHMPEAVAEPAVGGPTCGLSQTDRTGLQAGAIQSVSFLHHLVDLSVPLPSMLQGAQYDVVLDSALYHVFQPGPSRDAYVANVHRLVKPGGWGGAGNGFGCLVRL